MEWVNTRTPAYSWYDNDTLKYKNTYGALYKGYSVNTGKLCPTGWHVPTNEEWGVLIDYLGGAEIAGDKLKEKGKTHWPDHPNTTKATNESGFTALPGGSRNVAFGDIRFSGYWWSSSPSADNAWYCVLFRGDATANKFYGRTQSGFSVRCLKNK